VRYVGDYSFRHSFIIITNITIMYIVYICNNNNKVSIYAINL